MSEKHKKTCTYLNYVELLLILALTVTGCVSISEFASLVCGLVDTNFRSSKKITTGIKKYKSTIKKKKKKKLDKIVLLGKTKLDTSEVLIYKPLIDSMMC